MNEFHKNKHEIHKNRTLGKKPGWIPDPTTQLNPYKREKTVGPLFILDLKKRIGC